MNMKFVFLAAVTLTLSACASMYKDYRGRTMVRVQHQRNYEPVNAKTFRVEDQYIAVEYLPDTVDSGISVKFVNKTDKAARILWDESTYMAPSGQSERIFHSGVKIADRGAPQAPSVIPPKSHLADDLIPITKVDWSSTLGNWEYSPLCGSRSVTMHTIDDDACVGQTFGYFITYEIDGKKKNLLLKYKYASKEPLPKGA